MPVTKTGKYVRGLKDTHLFWSSCFLLFPSVGAGGSAEGAGFSLPLSLSLSPALLYYNLSYYTHTQRETQKNTHSPVFARTRTPSIARREKNVNSWHNLRILSGET